ncbi:MAG: hypothetical protein HW416_1298 [Chloroflexi bacterium]|nr:hypothetical protein [Chloroflexota bacterium]
MKLSTSFILLIALALAAGCAPPASPREAARGSAARQVDGPPKQLTLALDSEPGNLASLMEGGGTGPAGVREAVQHRLSVVDDRGQVQPQLASELPSTDKGSWIVRPDGTMQTTHRLRPGVTWQDGAPLSTRDFVFALTIHQDPAMPVNNPSIARVVSRIEPIDDLTMRIEWSKQYPFAHQITEEDLGPLPAHLLQGQYDNEKDRFPTLPYWKGEFVGTGPFRINVWEPGSHLILKAYDGFYGGRARIDTIVYRIIPSHATIVANLLAGTVDGIALDHLDFNEITLVQRQWELDGKTATVVSLPRKWRFLGVQFRPEAAAPREILDVRVRRGLLHALDRQAMANLLFDGKSPISENVFPQSEARWEWIKDVVVSHEHDTRRAQELLTEAGLRRGADGLVTNATGDRLTLPIWVTGDPQGEQELAVVADSWKTLGVTAEQYVVPPAQQRDRQMRSSFPAFEVTSNPVAFTNISLRFYAAQCPNEANRFTGNNRGCYQTRAMDQVVDGLQSAIAVDEQRRLWRDYARIISEDLPVIPMYFKIDSAIFRDGVTGVRAHSNDTTLPWNVAEWDLR